MGIKLNLKETDTDYENFYEIYPFSKYIALFEISGFLLKNFKIGKFVKIR
jgi:hypothetical protein